jgi:hypothetical protein
MVFKFPGVNLFHQVSDKRLLRRCGSGNSYLIETLSASFRPPGLRIRRAEVRTKRLSVHNAGKSTETGNVLSEIESQGFRK